MTEPLIVARAATAELALLPAFANRHGCITGATGTGKTIMAKSAARSTGPAISRGLVRGVLVSLLGGKRR